MEVTSTDASRPCEQSAQICAPLSLAEASAERGAKLAAVRTPSPSQLSSEAALAAVDRLQTELLNLAEENRNLHSALKEARRQCERQRQQLEGQTEDFRILCSRLQELLSQFEGNHREVLSNCVAGNEWKSGASASALTAVADLLRLKLHGAVSEHLAQDRRAAVSSSLREASAEGAEAVSTSASARLIQKQQRIRPLPLIAPQTSHVRRQQERFADLLQRNEQLKRQNESLAQQNALMLQQQAQFHRQQQLWLEQVQPTQEEESVKRETTSTESPAAWGHCASATFDEANPSLSSNFNASVSPCQAPRVLSPSVKSPCSKLLQNASPTNGLAPTFHSTDSARNGKDAFLTVESVHSKRTSPTSLSSPVAAPEATQVVSRLSPPSPSSSIASSRSSFSSSASNASVAPKPTPATRRPLAVPALSTQIAGTGSWLGGEREPGEYPQGV